MKHTPIKIGIMLKCYYLPNRYKHVVQAVSSAHHASLNDLIQEGLIEEFGDGSLKVTARGVAWVHMLRDTPLPKLKECWVDPRTNTEVNLYPVL